MRKLLSIAAVVLGFATITMVAVDTEAARVGGGRSAGRQSSSATSAPAQKSTPAQTASTPPVQQPSGMSRWLGPLAGLAAGIGLASLFGNSGLGAAMGGILMVLLLLGVGFFIYRMIAGKKAGNNTAPGYAGATAAGGSAPQQSAPSMPAQFTGNAAAPGSLAATVGGAPTAGNSLNSLSAMNAAPAKQWPADFNAAEFERQALANFSRLQAANDAGDVSTMRDFLTPDLYAELEAEMKSAWGSPQKTEPVDVRAEVIDVVTEGLLYVVSVRFTGQIRENGVLNPLNEVWHLEKPTSGSSGWRVAGIQQVS